ncbi:MAG: hypothetical protein ACOC6F_03390 [bacterium]
MRLARNTLGWGVSLVLAAAHALAYYSFLPLSLGPRVVLQPWLMQQGFLLYEHIADEHPPLLYLVLRVLQPLASDSLTVAKVVLVSSIFLVTLLAFWAGLRARDWVTGLASAFFFAIWSPTFGYGKLWHETFLAIVYAILLVLWSQQPTQARDKGIRPLTGLLLGVALLFKQHALAVLGALVLWDVFASWRTQAGLRRTLPRIASSVLVALLPLVCFAGYHFLRTGSVENFLFWTVTFNFINNYRDLASMGPQPGQLKALVPAFLLIIPFCVRWLKSVLTGKADRIWYSREGRVFVLLLAGSLTAYPRFGLFHLQPSLPPLAFLSALELTRSPVVPNLGATRRNKRRCLLLIGHLALIVLWIVHTSSAYHRPITSDRPRRIWEYTELVPLAEEVRQQIEPHDHIYVFPDDEATANLYYLLRRTPPDYWSPTSYPWFTLDILKPRIIDALDRASPEWVVYFPGRWSIEQHGKEILAYIQSHYQLSSQLAWAEGEVHLMERLPEQQTR